MNAGPSVTDLATVALGMPSPRVAADPRLIECWLLFRVEFPGLMESDRSLIEMACVYRAYMNSVMDYAHMDGKPSMPDDKTANAYLRIINALHSLATKRQKVKPSGGDAGKPKKGSKYDTFTN